MRASLLGLMALVLAQESWCGLDSYERLLEKEYPDLPLRRLILEASAPILENQRLQYTEMGCTPSRYVIPVVFHVVYSSSSDSIPFSRIWGQMLRLFEDFRRVPETAGYAGAGVDMEIEFSLATKDPSGNPTTGVVYWRYDQPPLNWTSRDFCRETQDYDMKQATGWDRNKYLNIWIVPRLCVAPTGSSTCSSTNCGSVAGYAYFPSSPSSVYGAVIGSSYFWGSGLSRSIRTTVHEVGHNLNLYHPFQGGCGSSNCATSGDRVCDTPPTAESNFSVRRQNTCTTDFPDLPDNPRNIMDYVNDVEMTHFSAGQRARAWSAINSTSSRLYPLTRAANQAVTGTGPYGYVKAYFSARPRVGCVGQPVQVYSYSLGMPHVYQWDFSGGLPDDPTASCPQVIFSQAGTYDVRLIVENLSGRRDTLLKTGYIQVLDTVYSLPYREGFEGTSFPPVHTWIDNPDGGRTWERFRNTNPPRGAYGASQTSMRLLFYNYSRYREKDSWISAPLDLSPYTDPDLSVVLRFSWAYACLTYENTSANPPSYLLDYVDSLRVYVSTDCGASWTLLWEKGGRDLATHPDGCLAGLTSFLPTNATWMTDSVSLDAYKGLSPVKIRFEGVSGWGNNLFLDDIVVDTVRRTTTRLLDQAPLIEMYVAAPDLYVYTSKALEGVRWGVYDALGRAVYEQTIGWLGAGHHRLALPTALPAGLYIVRLESATGSSTTVRYWQAP